MDKFKKILIIDDFDDCKLNDKYKILLLTELDKKFGNILVTADTLFLFNANVSFPKEFSKISHFNTFKIKDIGHKLRDELIRKWVVAGREESISEQETYSITEKYRHVIDNVLGTNYVPRKPFIILVLLQALQSGSANEIAHSSFVRYYKYLIDSTILHNIPKNKTELYYAFLPEIAHKMFLSDEKHLSKEDFEGLITEFSKRKAISESDLTDVKSNLLSLGVLIKNAEFFKFKHSYTYYYFISQYFSDNCCDR